MSSAISKVAMAAGVVAAIAVAATTPSLAQARWGHAYQRTMPSNPYGYNTHGYDGQQGGSNGGYGSYAYPYRYRATPPGTFTYWPPTGFGNSYTPGMTFGG